MLLISVSSLFVTVYALAPNNVAEASISSKLGVSTLVDKVCFAEVISLIEL